MKDTFTLPTCERSQHNSGCQYGSTHLLGRVGGVVRMWPEAGLYWTQRAMQSVMAATRHVCSKGVIRTYLFWLGGGTCTTASVETVRGKSSRALLNYPHYAVPLHFRWLRNAVSIHLSSSEKILECHAHVSERSQRSLAERNCCLWSVIVMAVRSVRVPLRVRHVVRHTVRSRPSPPHS
jgi:hypothetical protein